MEVKYPEIPWEIVRELDPVTLETTLLANHRFEDLSGDHAFWKTLDPELIGKSISELKLEYYNKYLNKLANKLETTRMIMKDNIITLNYYARSYLKKSESIKGVIENKRGEYLEKIDTLKRLRDKIIKTKYGIDIVTERVNNPELEMQFNKGILRFKGDNEKLDPYVNIRGCVYKLITLEIKGDIPMYIFISWETGWERYQRSLCGFEMPENFYQLGDHYGIPRETLRRLYVEPM